MLNHLHQYRERHVSSAVQRVMAALTQERAEHEVEQLRLAQSKFQIRQPGRPQLTLGVGIRFGNGSEIGLTKPPEPLYRQGLQQCFFVFEMPVRRGG